MMCGGPIKLAAVLSKAVRVVCVASAPTEAGQDAWAGDDGSAGGVDLENISLRLDR